MTTNHHALNHTRLATLRSTKSMLGIRNKILPDSTTFYKSGIKIHAGPILHFLTTIINGV
jgi:hypothetical protein